LNGRSFGEMAEEYDRVRPGYPPALVDDVLAYSGLSGAALEVGAGTGKATLAFAARGVPVVAVEPDAAMADVLARNAYGVHIVRSTFERYRPKQRFGLLYSADAWHWTDPASRWHLAAAALAGGGALALFWHRDRVDDPALRQSMVDVLAAHAPSIVVKDAPVEPARLPAEWPGDELAGRPEFTDLVARAYPSRRTVPAAEYLTHLATRAQIRALGEPVRARLFAALAERLDGADVPVAADAVLYLARRR